MLLLLLLFLCGESTSAQTICYSDHRQKGIEAYKAGDYKLAKKHFEFILNSCDDKPATNDIQSWIDKCNAALKPTTLSLERKVFLFGAEGGTETISVNCNRDWIITHTSSSMFSAARVGNNLTIYCHSNSKTDGRDDYFYVKSSDGQKSVRVAIYQNGKKTFTSTKLTLSVSKTSITCGSLGTTEYLTVSSDRAWKIQYPSGNIYSVTRNGDTLKVVVYANNTKQVSRSECFYVRLLDGSENIKVQILQGWTATTNSNTSSSAYATIHKAWIEHNVYENGVKGMRVHVKFDAYNVLEHKVGIVLHFRNSTGEELKDYNGKYVDTGGKVAHSDNTTASYTNTTWNDFTLFFPYSELHISSGSKNINLTAEIGVYDWTTNMWLSANNYTVVFSFSN